MKKFIAAILCLGLVAAITAGCSYTDALDDHGSAAASAASDATADSASESESPKADPADYDDNLDGLESYFAALGYLDTEDNGKVKESSVVKMDSSLIGAEAGKKYTYNYEGSQITIELYEYNTDSLNETAKTVTASVKDSGSFTILDLPAVKAYLSDGGKYLMIYNDNKIDDENPDKTSNSYKHREAVVKSFNEFNK